MLARVHDFVVRQLGHGICSLRTIESSPQRLTVEVSDRVGTMYVAKAAAETCVAVEVDALLAAEAAGVPHAGLRGYELPGDEAEVGLILSGVLPGVALAELPPVALVGSAAHMVARALVALHGRAVDGWGPLDSPASRRARTPIGTFETWLASATFGLSDALRRIEAAEVLQVEVSVALRDAIALTPEEPATGSRWLHGDLSSHEIVVSADATSFLGFARLSATECGDPARDLARWVLREGAPQVGPILDAYGAVADAPVDPWRVWWWALIDAVRGLDRSIAHGTLSPQLDMAVRIVDLLDEAGLRNRPSAATR
jgi:hypothetical protein